MEISDVKQHIKTGQFDKYYIFYGEEYAVMKLYLQKMAEKGGYILSYVDSLIELMSGSRTKSLVPVHHLYVVLDDKEYLTTDKMWDKFKGLKDDIVVFYYTTADKRLKFWKHFKDTAVEFPILENKVLVKYIQKEAPLNESSCNTLIDATDGNYGRILLELDKVCHYANAENIDVNTAFNKLIKAGAIYFNPKDAIFDFTGAVLDRDTSRAFNLLSQSYAVGEANLTLISVLYTNFKTLLQVQSSENYKKLGLNGFAVKNVIQYRDNYSNGELIRALKILREVEYGIKRGLVPDEISMQYALVQIM